MHNKTGVVTRSLCFLMLCLSLFVLHWQVAAAQSNNQPNPMVLFEQRSNTVDQAVVTAKASTIPNAQATVLPPPSDAPNNGPPANFCVTDAGRCPLAATVPAGQNCLCTTGNLIYGGKTAALSPSPGQPDSVHPANNLATAAQPAPPPILQPPATTLQPAVQVSLRSMVRHSNVIVQAVMLFLLLCSAASWAVFLYKSLVFRKTVRNTKNYSASFQKAVTMDNAVDAVSAVSDGPARRMLTAAKQEWDSTLYAVDVPLTAHQSNRLLQRLVLAMGTAQEQALTRLGNYMGLLATVSSTAPFIGLFGTVWGILDSFERISASTSTSLSVVAPGIAEALLATAVGLFTAIPATMFYNRFAREIGKISGMLDNVAAELIVFASRDIERLGK